MRAAHVLRLCVPQVEVQTQTVVLVNAETQMAVQYTQNLTATATRLSQTAVAEARRLLLGADQAVYATLKSAMGFTNGQLLEYVWLKHIRTGDSSKSVFALGFEDAAVKLQG